MKSKNYVRSTVAIVTAATLLQTLVMSNSIFNVQALAAENTASAEEENNKSYSFSLTPINSEIATKLGNSKIKITKGDAESFSLTPRKSENGISSTNNLSDFDKDINWLTIVLESDKYGSFTVPAGWKVEGSVLCATISKGSTNINYNNNTNEIEFSDDVVFKFKVNFTDSDTDTDDSDDSDTDEQVGWQQTNNIWYYYKTNGKMATGWITDNGKWYYLKPNGSMATGWIEDKGKWYYLCQDGSMACNTYVNGYYIDINGVWVQ